MCELEPMFNLAVPSGCSNERYRSNCSGSSTRGKMAAGLNLANKPDPANWARRPS